MKTRTYDQLYKSQMHAVSHVDADERKMIAMQPEDARDDWEAELDELEAALMGDGTKTAGVSFWARPGAAWLSFDNLSVNADGRVFFHERVLRDGQSFLMETRIGQSVSEIEAAGFRRVSGHVTWSYFTHIGRSENSYTALNEPLAHTGLHGTGIGNGLLERGMDDPTPRTQSNWRGWAYPSGALVEDVWS